MKTYNVKIKGVASLLQNRVTVEDLEKTSEEKVLPTPEEEVERKTYKNSNGCYVPSKYLEAMLVEAGKRFKQRKFGTFKKLARTIVIEPEEIPLNKEEPDEIDKRPANIRGNLIVNRRPRFNNWEIEFKVTFDDEIIPKDTVKNMLIRGGKTVGIGAYRPKFGRFEVEKFEEIE